MPLPGPCPVCHRLLDNHCARGCGWMVCLNGTCRIRFIDDRTGRRTWKTRVAE